MATRVIDDSKLNDIAVAIQAKDSGGQMTVDEMPTRIEALPEIVDEEAALVLIDWEGTLLRSYTRDEVMTLTELPNPTTLPNYAYADHEYLVFAEWNWSIEKAKSYCQKYKYMSLYVGAVYNPSDGQDHYKYWNSRVQIERYAKDIKFAKNTFGNYSYSEQTFESISLPNDFYKIGGYALRANQNLKTVIFPKSLTQFDGYCFYDNVGLEIISLPETFTSLGVNTIHNVKNINLKHINLPDGITKINASQFTGTAFTKINIPDTVTEIKSSAFSSSYLLFVWIPKSVLVLEGTSFGYTALLDVVIEGKPTIPHSNVFAGSNSNLQIYVPRENLEWFSTETNWADIYAQFTFVAIEDNIEYLESLGFNVDEYKEVA